MSENTLDVIATTLNLHVKSDDERLDNVKSILTDIKTAIHDHAVNSTKSIEAVTGVIKDYNRRSHERMDKITEQISAQSVEVNKAFVDVHARITDESKEANIRISQLYRFLAVSGITMGLTLIGWMANKLFGG